MSVVLIGVLFPAMLAAGPQEPPEVRSLTVSKQERSTYIPLLEKYRDAEAALAANPSECVTRCTELIEDKTIKDVYREARVRITNTDSSYGDYALFAPYQLRGRALMSRARAAAGRDRPLASKLAKEAVEDLDASLQRGLKSSGAHLDQARELVNSFKETPLAADPRLAEALKIIEDLNQRRDRREEPEEILRRCDGSAAAVQGTPHLREWRLIRDGAVRALADRFQVRLRETLPAGKAWATLKELPPAEFNRRFALPADPALEWSRRCRECLLRVRAVQDPAVLPVGEFLKVLTDAGGMAVEAAERDGESRAFGPLEGLARDLCRSRLDRLVEKADELTPAELRARREEARSVLEGFRNFSERLDKELAAWPDQGASFRRQHPFLPSHLQDAEDSLARFPADFARIDEIGKELFDTSDPRGLWGDSPREALKRFEDGLPRLDRPEGRSLTRDSRRKVATYLLVARASRLLLQGERVADIARREDIQGILGGLQDLGGPLPEVMSRVSPKIRAIAGEKPSR